MFFVRHFEEVLWLAVRQLVARNGPPDDVLWSLKALASLPVRHKS